MHKIIEEDACAIANSEYIEWENLRGKTVLIAGANGYVPQFFVHALLKRNDLYQDQIQVVALCRNEQKAKERFGEYANRADFQLLLQDVTEEVYTEQKIDYIIHAASPAGIKVTMDHPKQVFCANVNGCMNLLELALKKKARLMYLSSVDVYGTLSVKRIAEQDIGCLNHLGLRNVYAASKRAAETICMCFGKEGADVVIVRPSQIMGPGISLDDERLHINMISQMLAGNQIVLKGDGTPKRTFIYVSDAVAGMLAVLTKGEKGEVYNICTEQGEATVRELAEIFAKLKKDKQVKVVYNMETRKTDPAVTQVVSNVCVAGQKLRELGWASKLSLAESCNRMLEYYESVFGNES